MNLVYPRTSSDGEKPVTIFKAEMAKVLRKLAKKEIDDLKRIARGNAMLDIADMLDNMIIEGE